MLERDQALGRYRIVELIGSGGMGEVYLAEDTELQRRVAIKLFTRDETTGGHAYLLHEARAASALSHPNVCTVFEVGEADGRPFIAMEYVEGRTLDTLIAGRELPIERVLRYGSQIADAVAHAHEHGIVHRDLKSANVVITNDGRAKVLDFGLASTVGGDAGAATQEVTSAEAGRMSGTLSYMAPEVLRGQDAGPRSDIWALGVVLYEAAFGHLPFRGETAFELSSAIMNDSADIPVDTSPGLKAAIQRCLQKAPGERYQSAAEVRAALEMLHSGGSTSNDAVSAEVAAAAKAAGGPNWTAIAAGFSVVAVLGLAAWIMFWGPSMPSTETDGPGGAPTEAASSVAIGASGRPTIAVLPFRDRMGADETAWMGEGVPSMLVTGLAQTQGLDVVGSSRVQEIVSQLGVERLQGDDAAALSEFGARTGAGAVVAGDLYYTGTEYRIEAQVEDVNSGRVLNAYSVTGPFVFGLVDDLVAQIRDGLEFDPSTADRAIADVTTDSLDAWRAFDRGMQFRYNVRRPEALAAFEEAIAIDPDFALAKFEAARYRFFMADPATADEYDAYVKANLDRIPERDRLYVEATYLLEEEETERAEALLEEALVLYPDHEAAWLELIRSQREGLGLSHNPRQVETMERAVRAMPASGLMHNQLGYGYLFQGRYTEAVREIEKYVALNPEEANALDSLAEVYLVSGQPQLAFDTYTRSLEVDPTWIGGYYGRTQTLGMMGRYAEALDETDALRQTWMAVSPSPFSIYPMLRGTLLSKLGRYDEAMQLIRAAQTAVVSRADPQQAAIIEMFGAFFATEAEDFDTVRTFALRALDTARDVDPVSFRLSLITAAQVYLGVAELRSGDLDAARQTWTSLRRSAIELNDPEGLLPSDLLAAELALVEGDLAEAERLFAAATPELKAFYSASQGPPSIVANNHPFRDGLARVRAAGGDIAGAIDGYRDLITVDFSSRYNAFEDPRYVLRFAELLDEAGRDAEAREQYLRFVDFWSDADEQFRPIVERARARAAELAR